MLQLRTQLQLLETNSAVDLHDVHGDDTGPPSFSCCICGDMQDGTAVDNSVSRFFA